MKFDLTLSNNKIQENYQKILKDAVQKAKIEGFREGKAPVEMVEKRIGKQKLLEEAIRETLPEAYINEINSKNLKPITAPRINPKKVEPDQDLIFEVEIAQAPTVQLGDYKDVIKGAKAKDALWVPGKDEPKEGKAKDKNQLLQIIFEALIENIKVDIPSMILEEEVNKSLSNLLNQLNKLGLTVEQYLKSMNMTSDQLKNQYEKSANESLQLEFILDAITRAENIEVSDQEVAKMIESAPDEKSRKSLEAPEEKAAIKSVLQRRKTIDFLLEI